MRTSLGVATVRRLPHYLNALARYEADGRATVSTTEIAADLGLTAILVRKDIEATGVAGQTRVGYKVSELARGIRRLLNWDNTTDAFLAGAGNLGSALLGYGRFEGRGLRVVAAFDNDPAKVGTQIHGKPVLPMEKLESLARRMRVRLGIVCVPAAAAQEVVDRMVAGGIAGIWNFAPAAVRAPEGVIVQNEELASGLAILSHKLARRGAAVPPLSGRARRARRPHAEDAGQGGPP